ncbi:MAG TPA: lipid-binding SYLF domain-containing protein [Pirellulales bacterium]|nr:lipid-binding SYLF domain-containing protein [Pirellulales bacterium]
MLGRTRRMALVWAAILAAAVPAAAMAANREQEAIDSSAAVLREVMTIPAKRIPESLLAEAYGVAIVPDVIKIGFVGGIQRGKGVVLVRDASGAWGLPKFVTLTGGSVGWQAGAQATDVVLVFRTQKSVEGLLNGKFTLGADAAVAAGPVGRRAEASTDAKLQAEILSYSRSRGLFAGVSLGGTVLHVDSEANALYYRNDLAGMPTVVPPPASALANLLAEMTAPPASLPPPENAGPPQGPSADAELLQRTLVPAVDRLYARLDERWKNYFALPANLAKVPQPPDVAQLKTSLERFDKVAADPQYQALWRQPEFKAAHQFLQEYVALLVAESPPQLDLPPPPAEAGKSNPPQR